MGDEQKKMGVAAMAFGSGSGNSVITGAEVEESTTNNAYGSRFYNAENNDNTSVANSCSSQSSTRVQEHDYIGLGAESSSVDKPEERKSVPEVPDLNLGLRLGPPKNKTDCEEHVEKENANATRLKLPTAGSKRGYSQTVEGTDFVKGMSSKLLPAMFPWSSTNRRPTEPPRNGSFAPFQRKDNQFYQNNQQEETPSGPMVGWPPVQSFRKNTLVSPQQTAKASAEREQIAASEQNNGQGTSLFVKVYMDGVPIGRKVDLDANNSYPKLSSALRDMFSGFVNGQNMSKQKPGLSSGDVQNLFDGYETEYVLTYEDKDGDLMLVGDVPWRMFAATVKRLRIMKGSDAIGLGGPKDCSDRSRTVKAAG